MRKAYMTLLTLVASVGACAATFYVSPTGSDAAAGTKAAPFKTLEKARDAARASKEAVKEIIVAAGDYCFTNTFKLDVRDNGLCLRAEKAGTVNFIGGQVLTGWRKDGDKFWAVDLPEVKAGTWDFRALVVNGAFAPRACYPGQTNRLENLGGWNLPLLQALAGWWPRKPTYEELTQMPYKLGDLPKNLDVKNAEVRLYHMWSESLCGVASNDTVKGMLYLSAPAAWPMGACKRRQYVVYNIREGLLNPGEWYLDRTAGKVVYYPKPGDDMRKIRVMAPRVETIFDARGKNSKARITNVVVEGVNFMVTTPPLKKASFGGSGLPAAVEVSCAEGCAFRNLTIRNAGGIGCSLGNFNDGELSGCEIAFIGARGLGVGGKNVMVADNKIHDVGLLYPSSSAVGFGGEGNAFRRNEVFNVPYSGIILGGGGHMIEDNLVYRVMQILHDGAAFYGNIRDCAFRGNVVHDVVANGKGFGASAYYIDEGGENVTFVNNVAEGVPRPIHMHITRGIQVRNNTFLSDGDMTISFQRSINCAFENNTLIVGGKMNVSFPNAVTSWESNKVFTVKDKKDPSKGHAFGNAKPTIPVEAAHKGIKVLDYTARPAPVLDGEMKAGEWEGRWQEITRDAARRVMGGSPAMLMAARDTNSFYLVVAVTSPGKTKLSNGHVWNQDDGVQIDVAGRRIQAFIDGTITVSDEAFRKQFTATYAGLAKKNRGMGKLQYYAFVIPLSALGNPVKGAKVPFNVTTFSSAYQEFRHLESGTPTHLQF